MTEDEEPFVQRFNWKRIATWVVVGLVLVAAVVVFRDRERLLTEAQVRYVLRTPCTLPAQRNADGSIRVTERL